MPRLALLHSRLQVTIALAMAVLVLWGLLCAVRGGVGRGYTAALAVGWLLIVAEGVLGLLLLFGANTPTRLALHVVYGGVAALLLPAAALYNRGRSGQWEAMIYAAAALFLLGIAIRAYQTGGA